MSSIEFFYCNDKRYAEVKKIRTSVFTNEQGADSQTEFDEYDEFALFALLYEDGTAVGTARIAKTPCGYKIGRIAVSKECRGKGYGAVIVNSVTEKAFSFGADKVFVDAQNYAVSFYEKLGFTVNGSEIYDRGLPHIPMIILKKDFDDTLGDE
ncbi:MAG: GNAT family N-acetyltransferase [Acetobacter sp.]|nr:GNAT family N-acetyltransferase [Bacteroides sp.]MCM1340738.1 GNAT family N-acetyltransferase [Acetobacter sp.]MCM1433075.1 GNAT family N-acetyltransferase [Clostridiales bacterium]